MYNNFKWKLPVANTWEISCNFRVGTCDLETRYPHCTLTFVRSVQERKRKIVEIDEDFPTEKYSNIQIMPMYAQFYNACDIAFSRLRY
jgi:hypothetical protein